MAIFLVRAGGTADGSDSGRHATNPALDLTTAATSNYYSSIQATWGAGVTGPTTGDIVLIADDHSQGSTPSFNNTYGLTIMACSAIDTSKYRRDGMRPELISVSGGDLWITGCRVYGLRMFCYDDFNVSTSYASWSYDCEFELESSNDRFVNSTDGGSSIMENCHLIFNYYTQKIAVASGNQFIMKGGSVHLGAALNNMFGDSFGTGGAKIHFHGTKFTGLASTFMSAVGISRSHDRLDVEFIDCIIPSGSVYTNTDCKLPGRTLLALRSGSNAAEREYGYYYWSYGGLVTHDDVIYRDDDTAFPISNSKVGLKVETHDRLLQSGERMRFDFPYGKLVDLTDAAKQTLRFYVASTDALTDKDIAFRVSYNDGTDTTIRRVKMSGNTDSFTGILNPVEDGTALPADVGSDWRNGAGALAGYNEYYVDVDTSDFPGIECVPEIEVIVTKDSTTIHIASEFDAL